MYNTTNSIKKHAPNNRYKTLVASVILLFFVAIPSCSNNYELKLGHYVTEGDLHSRLVLSENNLFDLSANPFISLMRRGNFIIENNILTLTAAENEIYVFTINNDRIIFNSGTWLENWIEPGTEYFYYDSNNSGIIVAQAQVNMEPEIIMTRHNNPWGTGEDVSFILKRVGNSVIFAIRNGSERSNRTYRYMDVTSTLNADEFIRISDQIKRIGIHVEVTRPDTHFWVYEHRRFGEIETVNDFGQPKPRLSIEIDGFEFIYYPEGGFDVREDEELSDTWFYNVPFYQDGHVYVRIEEHHFTDTMSDEELFEATRGRINILRGL